MKNIYILCIVLVIQGCLFLPMDYTDNIKIENNTQLKMDLYVNFSFPDTSFFKAESISNAEPFRSSNIYVINKKWKEVFEKQRKVTVFFAEWITDKAYNQGKRMSSDIYGKLILSQAKLDSLGGKIRFPRDVRVTEAYYEAVEKAAADSLESQ